MNRFDDLSAIGQPADELETELRETLARRSEDITEPAALRPGTDAPVSLLPRLANRATDVPGGLPGTLLAAAVVTLLVLGSVLGVRSLGHHRSPAATQPSPSAPTVSSPAPSPSRTGSSTTPVAGCPLPAGWSAALAGGVIAVDQPQNYPVSAGPDGSFLMMQTATGQVAGQTDFTHQELAIFDRAGHGTTVWQAADPVHDYADVSPDSAISAGWVVFGLTRSQNLAAHGVAAWNRSTGQLSTVRLLSAAEQNANLVIAFDPIVLGDTAYWIEQKYGDVAHQALVSQPLPDGRRSTQLVAQVSRLVAVGSGVALLHGGSSATTLTSGPGLDIPASVLAAGTGSWFGSDGTTLRWLDTRGGSVLLRSWRPGSGLTTASAVTSQAAGWVGPFLTFPYGGAVYDTRNGSTVRLPDGMSFVLVIGSDLITVTGTTKFGGSTVHRVPLSALSPTPC